MGKYLTSPRAGHATLSYWGHGVQDLCGSLEYISILYISALASKQFLVATEKKWFGEKKQTIRPI